MTVAKLFFVLAPFVFFAGGWAFRVIVEKVRGRHCVCGHDTARWMRSRVGQWCARNLPGGPRLWKRSMDAALERQAEFEHTFARDQLLRKVNIWAAASFSARECDLVQEWCNWRNTAESLHRARERRAGRLLDLPLALAHLPMMGDRNGK